MKVLIMGTHWDGLNLPDGVIHFPHKHSWRINNERTSLDKYGRPYCTICGGKPSFFSLDLVNIESFKYINGLTQGLYIEVETDYKLNSNE